MKQPAKMKCGGKAHKKKKGGVVKYASGGKVRGKGCAKRGAYLKRNG